MKKGFIFMTVVGGLVALLGLQVPPAASVGVSPAVEYFRNGSREFAASALKLEKAISAIGTSGVSKTDKTGRDTLAIVQAKMALADCRICYKKIEFFLEYFFRSAATVYNVPPKVEVEEPHMEYMEPTGLQVIESLLFAKDVFEQKDALSQQAALVSSSALDLGSLLYDFKADDRQVLESLRFELIRVMALSIAGFDAPALKSGIRESKAALQSMQEILRPYREEAGVAGMSAGRRGDAVSVERIITKEQPNGEGRGREYSQGKKHSNDKAYSPKDSVDFYLQHSLLLLGRNDDFDSFDRMAFLTEAALPLQQYLGEWIHAMGMDLNTDPVLNPQARNLFSPDAINLSVFPRAGEADSTVANRLLYGSSAAAYPNKNIHGSEANSFLIELGRKLFFEKALSGNYTRNCASCHEPANYFTDGKIRSLAYDGHSMVKRNAPTLLYAAYQYNQFLDGRVRSLEEQVRDVLHNPMEMNADFDAICLRLQGRSDYLKLYAKAFHDTAASHGTPADGRFTIERVAEALAAFVRTLAPRNADFDRYLAGNKTALTEAQVHGFNLFMGKAQCGTCHFAPLFNGLTPPLYERSEFEVVGVPATDDFSKVIPDGDSGRYSVFPISFYQGAFRIPGLRNIAVTAPYMHQGSFRSLETVLDFYNRGGGAGLGMDLPLQTLPSTPLGLTDNEKKDIIDFLHALTDRLPQKY